MSTTLVSPQLVAAGIDLGRVDAVRRHTLGMEVPGRDGCIYRYVMAGTAITAHNCLQGTTTPHVLVHTSAVKQVVLAIAPVGIAINQFGWVKIKGVHAGANVDTPAAGDTVGSSAVAGRLYTLVVTAVTASDDDLMAMACAAAGIRIVALTGHVANKATVLLQ